MGTYPHSSNRTKPFVKCKDFWLRGLNLILLAHIFLFGEHLRGRNKWPWQCTFSLHHHLHHFLLRLTSSCLFLALTMTLKINFQKGSTANAFHRSYYSPWATDSNADFLFPFKPTSLYYCLVNMYDLQNVMQKNASENLLVWPEEMLPSSRSGFSRHFEEVIYSVCTERTLTQKTFLTEEALCEKPCSRQLGNSSMFILTRAVQPAKF